MFFYIASPGTLKLCEIWHETRTSTRIPSLVPLGIRLSLHRRFRNSDASVRFVHIRFRRSIQSLICTYAAVRISEPREFGISPVASAPPYRGQTLFIQTSSLQPCVDELGKMKGMGAEDKQEVGRFEEISTSPYDDRPVQEHNIACASRRCELIIHGTDEQGSAPAKQEAGIGSHWETAEDFVR
eukprot:scaffold21219_cov42-Prasinocladus_malaysianus.AAC.1